MWCLSLCRSIDSILLHMTLTVNEHSSKPSDLTADRLSNFLMARTAKAGMHCSQHYRQHYTTVSTTQQSALHHSQHYITVSPTLQSALHYSQRYSQHFLPFPLCSLAVLTNTAIAGDVMSRWLWLVTAALCTTTLHANVATSDVQGQTIARQAGLDS